MIAPVEVVTLTEAQRKIQVRCRPLGVETIALDDAAGRFLARAEYAAADLVPFARSAMDGFAVRARETAGAPIRLPIVGAVHAGAENGALAVGTVRVIATGAPIPHGADAVIALEDADIEGNTLQITRAVDIGNHVFPPGEDARAGDLLAGEGSLLRPAVLGILAAAGNAQISVFRRPRVSIVSTGDEIVAIAATPAHGQIRNSTTLVLRTTLTALGAAVAGGVHVRDDRAALRTALAAALDDCDLLVTTGGASVGARDFVKSTLADLGVEFVFSQVALRPARPTAFGVRGDSRVLVLPGNPSSTFIALQEFVRPAVLGLAGSSTPLLRRIRARLAGDLHGKAERSFAAFGALFPGDAGVQEATPLHNQCSALTRTAAEARGLIIVPPGRRTYGPGDFVDVDVLE